MKKPNRIHFFLRGIYGNEYQTCHAEKILTAFIKETNLKKSGNLFEFVNKRYGLFVQYIIKWEGIDKIKK